MEKDAARQERRRRRAAALGAASSALSLACVAFCVLLGINAADLRNRVLDLEDPRRCAEDVDSLVEQRVTELLAQVNNKQQQQTNKQTDDE